jgi:hypothetical protein
MYGDHAKFRARLQTILVKHRRARNLWRVELGPDPEIQRSNTAVRPTLAANGIT